jgi:hypothetical protein
MARALTDDERATVRRSALPALDESEPRDTVATPALARAIPTVPIESRRVRPPPGDDLGSDRWWQPTPAEVTRIEPIPRPVFERAVRRIVRAIYLAAALVAFGLAAALYLLR